MFNLPKNGNFSRRFIIQYNNIIFPIIVQNIMLNSHEDRNPCKKEKVVVIKAEKDRLKEKTR